ncbi:MAG: Asp/Glu racemase [Gammaproteobacteria bacterium]|nr:Asp/Glu racemase [Gammaproteobacteria bacterium]
MLTRTLEYKIDSRFEETPSIGLIVLATDYTVEDEFRLILEKFPAVRLHHSRIANTDSITPESLADMAGRIMNCASILTPGSEIDVIAYGCTSATATIGEENIFELIRNAKPQSIATTPITAAFAAFHAFDARRIGLITPYIEEVNRTVVRYIQRGGFDVPVLGTFEEKRDSVVSRISQASIENAVWEITQSNDLDAVFVSCTSIKMVEFCEQLEKDVRLPLTSSNHAMAWHALRLAGLTTKPEGLGSLYSKLLDSREAETLPANTNSSNEEIIHEQL